MFRSFQNHPQGKNQQNMYIKHELYNNNNNNNNNNVR